MKKCLASMVFLLAYLLFIQPAGTLARDYEERVERSFNVKNGGTLYLDSDKGSIDVQSHAAEDVEVVVSLEVNTGSKGRAEEWFESFALDLWLR